MSSSVSEAFGNSSSAFLSPPANVVSGMRTVGSPTNKHFRSAGNSVEMTYLLNFVDPVSALTAAQVISYFTGGRNGLQFSDLFRSNLLLKANDNVTLALYEGVSVIPGASVAALSAPSVSPSTKAPAIVSVVNNAEASTTKSSNNILLYTLVPILGTICIAASVAAYYCIGRTPEIRRRISMVYFLSEEQ